MGWFGVAGVSVRKVCEFGCSPCWWTLLCGSIGRLFAEDRWMDGGWPVGGLFGLFTTDGWVSAVDSVDLTFFCVCILLYCLCWLYHCVRGDLAGGVGVYMYGFMGG